QGNILKKDDKVFLLSSNENMILPNFLGWSKADVLNYAELAGLNIETEGNGYVKQQSVPARRIVKKGDNIKIKFS
ncbi:PASTA domain-containing protein, partial [Gemella morbillorum]